MNINLDIVARALIKAGEEPLTPEEKTAKKGTRWRLIMDIYQATILEELASVAWTSMKKRARLIPSEEENLTSYPYAYELPMDMAKPVALNSEKGWLVEGSVLYTEDSEPILIYVRNGYTGKYNYEVADPKPENQEDLEKGEYYIQEEDEEGNISYIRVTEYSEATQYFVIKEEDYNFYEDLEFDPLLAEAIETRLASKIALKLTGDQTKYNQLYQEAVYMENRAQKASYAHGHNKGKGNEYWGDQLGLPSYGD